MRISSMIGGKKVESADVEMFYSTVFCRKEDLDTVIGLWVARLAEEGWTPIVDFMAKRKKNYDIYDVCSLFMHCGAEAATKAGVRMVRFSD